MLFAFVITNTGNRETKDKKKNKPPLIFRGGLAYAVRAIGNQKHNMEKFMCKALAKVKFATVMNKLIS